MFFLRLGDPPSSLSFYFGSGKIADFTILSFPTQADHQLRDVFIPRLIAVFTVLISAPSLAVGVIVLFAPRKTADFAMLYFAPDKPPTSLYFSRLD
jgi:hypothetical protein